MIACIVWLVCISVTLIVAFFRGDMISDIGLFGLIALSPAIIGLALWPVLREQWAQIIVIFTWLALAVLACLAVNFYPMAVLFMCVPAVGAMFEKERVIEGLLLASIMSGILYFGARSGVLADIKIASPQQADWAIKAGIAATISFLVAAMYGAAGRGNEAEPVSKAKKDMLASIPSGLMRVEVGNMVNLITDMGGDLLSIPQGTGPFRASGLLRPKASRKKFDTLLNKARAQKSPVQADFLLENIEGQNKHVQITACPLQNGDLMVHYYDLTPLLSEITVLRAASQTAKDEANSKALFFSGVSHELRTPLNAIIGFSDMMRSRLFGPLPGKYAEYADMIHHSGQHMLDLIGDVLDMSKIEAGKYEVNYDSFDAADVIRSSVKMIRPAADAAQLQMETEIKGSGGELIVTADRKALRQILLNLLSNAVKFTPKGGRVTVTGEIKDDQLYLEVSDQGVGISPEELNKIGQPFMQTQSGKESEARGSGLGLSLVRSLTDLHGGQMEIDSQPDQGTIVAITIPQPPH